MMEHAVASRKQKEPSRNQDCPVRRASIGEPPLHPMLQRQRQVGNQAVLALLRSGILQAKLAVSSPDDPEEKEADQVADRVMRSAPVPPIQRKCAACAEDAPCPKCEEEGKLQAKEAHGRVASVSSATESSLASLRGGGQPLPAHSRAFFEPRLGADFSHVRIHSDDRAAESAEAIDALAYTAGKDVVFGRGQYSPQSNAGRYLLAHELTHVVQQTAGRNSAGLIQRQPTALSSGAVPANPATAPPAKAAPVPQGDIIKSIDGVQLVADEVFMRYQLEQLVINGSSSAPRGFLERLEQDYKTDEMAGDRAFKKAYETDPSGVSAGVPRPQEDFDAYDRMKAKELEVLELTRRIIGTLDDELSKFIVDFENQAKEVALGMLAESEDRVNQERIRYGISWEEVEYTSYLETGQYTQHVTEYSMQDTPGSRALAEAATGLLKRKRAFDEAHKNMEEFGHSIGGAIGELARERFGAGSDKDMIQLNELRAVRNHAKRDLDVFRSQKTTEFPILAAYASEDDISEDSLEKLQQLASGKSRPATNMIGEEIKSRLEHIADVRKDIQDNGGKETKIWRVPRIIEGTRAIMGAMPGTMYGRLVDDKVKDEAPGIWTSILIGLLQLVLVLLAPATGGLTLIPAAAISVGQAYVHFREYERAQMLRGTDFGAMALSSEDPSLFWLAVDIVGAVVDVGAAAGAALRVFRALAPAARAWRAARGAEATEEAIRNLERTASELGGEALAKAVGKDARAGSEAMHVGETAEEAKALERAGEQMAEQELRSGAEAAESIAGRTVKVSESGALWSCASPCTLLRERYRGLLQRSKTWENKVKQLEEEAARIPKGKAGAAARQELAGRAASLEKELRTTSMPGDWTSPLKDTEEFKALVERRGSVAAELDHHPQNWSGKDEARFRYGKKEIEPEPGYRWTLDENGGLRYDRLDASLPAHRYNPATGVFEEAAEDSLIRATKGAEETRELATIPKKQREAMEAAFKKRGSLIAERDRLEALEEAGKISQKDSEKLRKIYAQVNEQSRQLGENAAEGIMKGKAGAKKIYPIGESVSKSGDFDQVWKVGGEFELVEAKGGSSGLGSRSVAEGVRAEQGTIEYAKSIAQNMAKNGATKEIRQLGKDLLAAIAEGKVKYTLVRAPIGEDVKISEFIIR
jgi:hypothetical protein